MGRVSVTSEEAAQLVSERLVPLFLALGSTAAVVKALNQAIDSADDDAGTIHANRVHALLSADQGRAINSATLRSIDRASKALLERSDVTEQVDIARDRLREKARQLHMFSGASAEEVASRLAVPLAVANALLAEHRMLVATEWTAPTDSPPPRAPDWSFQNVAVARCLNALTNGAAPRVGMVLPTGAGKTRTALRIILAKLRDAPASNAPALWVTHRKNLREQAHRELQKLIASGESSAADLVLASRIKFVMVRSLEEHLTVPPALIVIDEAHHAAAESYQPAFENLPPVPILLLTATPIRTDGRSIGIDEMAFTITYRELADRGVVLIPEFVDFPVEDFDWSPEAVEKLAGFVVEHTRSTFAKVLVLAPRIDRVREFHDAIVGMLPVDHPLQLDDVGYVHGSGNSLGIENEDFLARFASKPRAVLVSAQLLLEGFDDPAIDTVIITYPSASMVRLMQAAGRCVRYAPGKTKAFVVQARNDALAYHFDHRWLYEEINDFLRPEVVDVEYSSRDERLASVRALLAAHNVKAHVATQVAERVSNLKPEEACRLFLYGLPHFGDVATFETAAKWGVVLETSEDGDSVRTLFNEFCARGADTADPTYFLASAGTRFGLRQDGGANSPWRNLIGLLTAAYCAKCEVYGPGAAIADRRPYSRASATTWLKYVTFVYRPTVPAALTLFLEDCHNRQAICAEFATHPDSYAAAVKVPLPLAGAEAFLLTQDEDAALNGMLNDLREVLASAAPQDQFAALAGFLASVSVRIRPRLLQRSEFLISPNSSTERFLRLTNAS